MKALTLFILTFYISNTFAGVCNLVVKGHECDDQVTISSCKRKVLYRGTLNDTFLDQCLDKAYHLKYDYQRQPVVEHIKKVLDKVVVEYQDQDVIFKATLKQPMPRD